MMEIFLVLCVQLLIKLLLLLNFGTIAIGIAIAMSPLQTIAIVIEPNLQY